MGPLQFSLRWLLSVVTIIAIVLGAFFGLERLRQSAVREAIRMAVLDGRLPPEDARWLLGDEVDVLKTKVARPSD